MAEDINIVRMFAARTLMGHVIEDEHGKLWVIPLTAGGIRHANPYVGYHSLWEYGPERLKFWREHALAPEVATEEKRSTRRGNTRGRG